MSLDDARFAIRNALRRLEGFAAEVDPPTYFLAFGVQVGGDCANIPQARKDERVFGLSWESMAGDFYRLDADQVSRVELMTKDVVGSWREQDEAEAKGLPWEPAECTGHALHAILRPPAVKRLPGPFSTIVDAIGQAANVLAGAEGFEIKAPGIPGRTLWFAHVLRLTIQRPAAFGARVVWFYTPTPVDIGPPAWGGFQASLDARPLLQPGSHVVALQQDIRTASATAARLMLEVRSPQEVVESAAPDIDMNALANELARQKYPGPSKMVRLFAGRDDVSSYEIGEACCREGSDASPAAIKSMVNRTKEAIRSLGGRWSYVSFTIAGDRVVKVVEPF